MNIDSIFDVMSDFAHNRCVFYLSCWVALADIIVILSAAKIVSVNMRLALCPWLRLCNYNNQCIRIFFFWEAGASSHCCPPECCPWNRHSLSCLSSLTLQSSKLEERPRQAPQSHCLPRILHQSSFRHLHKVPHLQRHVFSSWATSTKHAPGQWV